MCEIGATVRRRDGGVTDIGLREDAVGGCGGVGIFRKISMSVTSRLSISAAIFV
jgi:hypothetical protein